MSLLQEDPQDLTTFILLQISTRLANSTAPAYQRSDFVVPEWAIVVNALLFAILCCSLIAALAGVIALQWVNEYDAGLDIVDARKLAVTRRFRFVGVEKWKMGEIIAILPLLLHASVFLFFVGMIEWMRNTNHIIYYICVGGVVVAAAFYGITATLGALFGNAPFRSPSARTLRFLIFLPAIFAIRTVRWVTSFLYMHVPLRYKVMFLVLNHYFFILWLNVSINTAGAEERARNGASFDYPVVKLD